MNSKQARCYIISMVLIILIVHLYMELYVRYLHAWPVAGQNIMDSLSLFSFKHFGALVINIVMGMIFGFESFLKNMQTSGKWHIDFKKLLIIGFPSLLFSIEFFHFVLLDVFSNMDISSVIYLIAPAREPFFRFLVGYTIITSIYKKT